MTQLHHMTAAGPIPFTEAEVAEWELQAQLNYEQASKVAIPQSVSPRQFKLALLTQNLLDDVELMVASSGDRALAITYEQALEFKREDPMVIQMSTALGKTEKDIDDFFILAGSL